MENYYTKKCSLKVYHGYGHTHNLIVMGHVLGNKMAKRAAYNSSIWGNITHIIKLFRVEPLPAIKVRLKWRTQTITTTSAHDGFFKFEWQSDISVEAGWHSITVEGLSASGEVMASQTGQLFVPHITQYAFISDIDDTVLISHSATIFKRLQVLFTKNPKTRETFPNVVSHYHLLANAKVADGVLNPFFYVSSSEWNLYDDLNDFFTFQGLPKGVFLLNELKKWYQLLKTGKTKHGGKLARIYRILQAFPAQKFVLLGDNSQHDPEIYLTVAQKFPTRIFAIYIKNVRVSNEEQTQKILAAVEALGIYVCFTKHNSEAITHSLAIGLHEGVS